MHVAGDELPLTVRAGYPAAAAADQVRDAPETLDEQAAAELLTGPLGGTDALGLRRLRRGLQAAARAAGQPPAAEPLAGALRDPRELVQAGWPGDGPDAHARRSCGRAERRPGRRWPQRER